MNKKMLFLLLYLATAMSCKKDIINDNPGVPGETGNPTTTQKIHIEVPAGSGFNPADGQVLSAFQFASVDSKGDANAYVYPESVNIAYVFDKDNELRLMGFISDTSKTISPGSTAIVLLHWGIGLPFVAADSTKPFFSLAPQNAAVKEWIAQFEQLFKADPLVLSRISFMDRLKDVLGKITNRGTLDVNSRKASDIKVDASDIRSGLQIFEDGLSQFSISNSYRRRTHGFLYKMGYKDLNDNYKQVLSEINETSGSDNDFIVDGRSAVNGFLGEVGKWLEGSSTTSFTGKSGPVPLDLQDFENEAYYVLRIIGPGVPSSKKLTKDESLKLNRLRLETFVFDFAIPACATVMSVKGNLQNGPTPAAKEKLLAFFEGQFKNIPDSYEEVKKGNYKKALAKYFENLFKDIEGENLNATMEVLAEYLGFEPGSSLKRLKNFNKTLALFDAFLATSDMVFVATDIMMSQTMEEWDITARSSNVKLMPDRSNAVPGQFIDLEAIIKNMQLPSGTHPFFEWSTTGKYGKLWDKGHAALSFETANSKPQYYCDPPSDELPEGENLDYVFVKAFVAGKLVGQDTAVINAQKYAYKMLPNNVTLTGKPGGGNTEEVLYLIKSNNKRDIKPNSDFDYKVIWETTGKHGKLSTKDVLEGQNTITTFDSDEVLYYCTDEETEEATESIKAKIYSKEKHEDEYRLINEAKATVNISNSKKKKVIHLPVTYMLETGWSGGYPNPRIHVVAIFPVDDSAKSYKGRFYNFKPGALLDAQVVEELTYTWRAGQKPPTFDHTYTSSNDIKDGKYYFTFWETGCFNCKDQAAYLEMQKQGLMDHFGEKLQAEITIYY